LLYTIPMLPMLLMINSGLLILATIFLIIAIGHAILTLTWTLLAVAAVIFFLVLVSEVILAFYSS